MKMTRNLALLSALALSAAVAHTGFASEDNMLNATQHPKATAAPATTAAPHAAAAASGTPKKTDVETIKWADVPTNIQKVALTNITKGQALYKIKYYVTTGGDPKTAKTVTVYEFQIKNPDTTVGAMWINDEGKWVGKPHVY